jgi:hypothetical protein
LVATLKRLFNITDSFTPRITIPKNALRFALKLSGKSNTNPDRIYSSDKIVHAGLQKPMNLEKALAQFSKWYTETHLNQNHS